jgi:hypothetical protein
VQSPSIQTGVHACAQLGARLVPCLSAVGIPRLSYYSIIRGRRRRMASDQK